MRFNIYPSEVYMFQNQQTRYKVWAITLRYVAFGNLFNYAKHLFSYLNDESDMPHRIHRL